jgi:hypothetical protein
MHKYHVCAVQYGAHATQCACGRTTLSLWERRNLVGELTVLWSFVFCTSVHFLVGLPQVLHIIVMPRTEIYVAFLGVVCKDSHLLLFKNLPSHLYVPAFPLKYFRGSICE